MNMDLTFEEICDIAAKRTEAKLSLKIWGDNLKHYNSLTEPIIKVRKNNEY